MERTPVSSSNICSVGYESDSQILEVEFNTGALYQYSNVPQSEFEAMMNADSKGTYFNANIKSRYSYSKM